MTASDHAQQRSLTFSLAWKGASTDGLAEFERALIMARTQAGIQKARENGVTFGRKVKLSARQKLIIAERHSEGETIARLAEDFGVGVGTIHRALHPSDLPAAAG